MLERRIVRVFRWIAAASALAFTAAASCVIWLSDDFPHDEDQVAWSLAFTFLWIFTGSIGVILAFGVVPRADATHGGDEDRPRSD